MKVLATYPPKRPQSIQIVYWVAATLILAATMYELFKFEDVPAFLVKHIGSGAPVELIAAIVVTIQVFAVPHLLGMKLSKLMRAFSIVCCVISCVTIPFAVAMLLLD